MKRNALWLLALVLAMGLLAAGCGGDDDDGDSDSEALTKEEYLAQGNEICEAGDAELNQAQVDFNDPAALEGFVNDTFVPNVQGQIDDLREGIPEDDADEVNQILDEAELALQDVKEDPTLITGDGGPFADISAQLHEYGLTSCAS
jgi:hypothetical protein